MTTHEMFGGRLQVYRRGDGRYWQCAARVGGKRFRESTHEEQLAQAKQVAEEWYLGLRGKLHNGVIVPDERTFRYAAGEYLREIKVLTVGTRSPKYIEFMEQRMNKHVLPYFGSKGLSQINRGMVQSWRRSRGPASHRHEAPCCKRSSTSGRCLSSPRVAAGYPTCRALLPIT